MPVITSSRFALGASIAALVVTCLAGGASQAADPDLAVRIDHEQRFVAICKGVMRNDPTNPTSWSWFYSAQKNVLEDEATVQNNIQSLRNRGATDDQIMRARSTLLANTRQAMSNCHANYGPVSRQLAFDLQAQAGQPWTEPGPAPRGYANIGGEWYHYPNQGTRDVVVQQGDHLTFWNETNEQAAGEFTGPNTFVAHWPELQHRNDTAVISDDDTRISWSDGAVWLRK